MMKSGAEKVRVIVFLIFLAAAVVQDIRTGKIKNGFNLSGVLAGVLLAVPGGVRQAGDAVCGLLLACVLGFVLYGFSMIRAGDAKLLWLIGAFRGAYHFFNGLLLGILTGGVFAMVLLLLRRDGRERMANLFHYFKILWMTRRYTPYRAQGQGKFPFSVPLALGAVLDFWITIW